MNILTSLYSFRKSDRDAVVLIILVTIVAIVLFPFVSTMEDDTQKSRYDNRGRSGSSAYHNAKYYAQPGANDGSVPAEMQCELFAFDPNVADSVQFLRLGLQPWQIRNIYKYRSKGGRYRRKEDFARLYGLTLEKYRQLEPYIMIRQDVMAADVISSSNSRQGRGERYTATTESAAPSSLMSAPSAVRTYAKLHHGETVDINTADTTELKRIPAIGSYFARRIVELRQRRQTFTSPEQLLSIRNFPETALAYMRASQNFSKIKVNSMSQKQLASHPLLSYTQARDIIALRRTTGSLHALSDLSALPSIPQEHLKRIAPYVVFD